LMRDRAKANEPLKSKSLYGVAFTDEEVSEVSPTIPRQLIERWRRLILPNLDRDWNKNILAKMIAGYLLDPVSVRCFLAERIMVSFKRLEDIQELFRKRMESENRGLNPEELATITRYTMAHTALSDSVKLVCETFSPKPRANAKAEPEEKKEDGPPEVPAFYRLETPPKES